MHFWSQSSTHITEKMLHFYYCNTSSPYSCLQNPKRWYNFSSGIFIYEEWKKTVYVQLTTIYYVQLVFLLKYRINSTSDFQNCPACLWFFLTYFLPWIKKNVSTTLLSFFSYYIIPIFLFLVFQIKTNKKNKACVTNMQNQAKQILTLAYLEKYLLLVRHLKFITLS